MPVEDIHSDTLEPAVLTVGEALDRVLSALRAEQETPLDFGFILELDDEDIAQTIESVPPEVRLVLWEVLPIDRCWPVLRELQHGTISNVINSLPASSIAQLTESADDADLLALADCLPQQMVDAILEAADEDRVAVLNNALSYEDDQVGRFLNRNILKIRPHVTVSRLRDRLWSREGEPPVAIFVMAAKGVPSGQIDYDTVLLADGALTTEAVARPVELISDTDHFEAVLHAIQFTENSSWYPVMREGLLLGAVSSAHFLAELYDANLDAVSRDTPGDEEDLFTPVGRAARIRAFWLIINLVTAFMASAVIGLFENALHEVVALAILMPVVASMGGIAGSQTLAIALRGLALNHLNDANIGLVLAKEARIAALNGLVLGLIIGLVVGYWFDSSRLGAIIFTAIFLNGLAAAYSGTYIPFVLKKMHIDPAVSGSVILTTVTDIVGFMVFLGLGSLVFLGW